MPAISKQFKSRGIVGQVAHAIECYFYLVDGDSTTKGQS